tara:strand:+ start:107 stop:385 length:279 start_codon:yes stop_codon:yes gene_type:complete
MAKKNVSTSTYLGMRDDRLRKEFDQAELDYASDKRNCTYDSERRHVVNAYMDHIMDIGMMAKQRQDWELVAECNSVLDSLQARMYRPKRSRF